MIYFIVTTCIQNYKIRGRASRETCPEDRKNQYINCINKLIDITKNIPNKKIIIIENNGKRKTFLDDISDDVFYTTNNKMKGWNKGRKELNDILECIKKYDIKDNDFIVKMTGRYLLDDNSNFIKQLYNLKDVDCICRYLLRCSAAGIYLFSHKNACHACFTGLIGMRCKYIKNLSYKDDNSDNSIMIERKWSEQCEFVIDKNKIITPETLGINICPGGHPYYFI